MHDQPMRHACEAIIDRLGLPWPFTAQAFCATVAASRGRPVHTYPHVFPDGGTSGVCISTELADHVFYEMHTSALHQEHIILHEIGHLVWGHTEQSPMTHERLPGPDLDASRVLSILGRTSHSGDEERAAELFAELVLDRVERARRLPPEPETDEVLNRMREALGR
jgi:hypothetical protein